MKQHYYFKGILLCLCLFAGINTFAYDVKINGIYYNFSGDEAIVTHRDDYEDDVYSGNVIIPMSVRYRNKTYSVTSIGREAFYNCISLTSVTIPNSVTSIGNSAFYCCTGLTSITIPNSVTSIGNSAFYWCRGLTSITIPNSVTSIGDRAFSVCSGLTSIKVEDWNTTYDSRYDCNAIIETASNTLIVGCQNTVIPHNVTSIGDYAFSYCSGLTSITIPNSVTSIGAYAFSYCRGLTSITIPNSVTSIGNYAFYNCISLTSITIPNSVTSIGDYAFSYCSGLTSITIPNSVTDIGNEAFSHCNNLTLVKMRNGVPVDIKAETFSNRGDAILQVPTGSKAAYQAANNWKDFKKIVEELIYGDVNVDEQVNVVDVVDIARFVVGNPSEFFFEVLADINTDGAVNLGDAVGLVNDIAGDQNFVKGWAAPDSFTTNDAIDLTERGGCLSMNLENEHNYTAFQFDLFVPEDVDVAQMMLNAERKQGHQLLYNKVESGHYRVAALSISNNDFKGNEGELLTFALNEVVSNEICIRGIHFFDAEGQEYQFEDVYGSSPTSIRQIDNGELRMDSFVYDLQGRKREKMQKGVNIANGRKIMVK